jgi:hypothetical protein
MKKLVQFLIISREYNCTVYSFPVYVYSRSQVFNNSAAVLSGCVGKVARTGLGVGAGGLLLFAVCKVGRLLLVQKDRKRMSQLAECTVN